MNRERKKKKETYFFSNVLKARLANEREGKDENISSSVTKRP